MDKQFIQEVETVSHEIVRREFPDEEEYFDFLSDLIIPKLQEKGPGKETEFLREMRAVHPLALGCTPVIITLVFQVLAQRTYRNINTGNSTKRNRITEVSIRTMLENIVENKEEQEEFSEVPRILMEYIRKGKMGAEKD